MAMKIRLKMKNISQRYDINWPRFGYKYAKVKICLGIMMVIYIKQQQHLKISSWKS